jgi:transcription antitermination factor NusG
MKTTIESTATPKPLPWYGVRVRSRHEQVASIVLRSKGYEPFAPSYKVRRRWSDRIKETEAPLFSGYLFCRLDCGNRLPVLTATGVVGIVGIGKTPAPIEEREIEAIRTVIKSGLPARPWPFVHQGDRVRVEYGPLRGVEGIVTSVEDQQRLVVSVSLLQRSIAVEMDPAWVAAQGTERRVGRR